MIQALEEGRGKPSNVLTEEISNKYQILQRVPMDLLFLKNQH
jgi:hypothetical protein